MFRIYKTMLCSPVDYAAEELKKYLRMMMPDCSEISIEYEPEGWLGKNRKESAVCAIYLGLMQDFGLDVSDAEDPALDDILYIDVKENGGVIAGDNPRSVLLAVYEYLRRQGCRWLFPGVDGEYIPVVEGVVPVQYRHKPTCRYRGQCNEGCEYQSNMLEAIEFTPKVGMNVFMLEYSIPAFYYRRYYEHFHNQENRAPEPVSNTTILQWKRQCEAEISRRGLQFHDMGHGWTIEPFGIDSTLREMDGDNDQKVPEENRKYLALVDGQRKIVMNVPKCTQFCMSNPDARKIVVQYTADYAQSHTNVDYLHLWLADAPNNHCECENCKTKTTSDWYVILLNELDEELTGRNLDTRIVFIVYTDTIWPPEMEKINHQDRFTLLLAPVGRSYTESLPLMNEGGRSEELVPYRRNQIVEPDTLEKNFAYFTKWKEMWKGANVAYEYHFWRHQYYDLSGISLSDIIHQDVRAYKKYDVNGIIEDGSQRSFFPTGLPFYVYARTLFDSEQTLEAITEEYFSCAFGDDWREFYFYMKELGEAFGYAYMEGQKSENENISAYYAPKHAEQLEQVPAITEKGRALIKAHYNMPYRVQTASVRLLELHAKYADLLAAAMAAKARGQDEEADCLLLRMQQETGREEAYFQTCYDHGLAFESLKHIFTKKSIFLA